MKSKLHSKLTDISKLRHGGLSSWLIADGKIRKAKSFETISTVGSCAEKSEDNWSKIGMLLHTDDIIEPVVKKTSESALSLSNTRSGHTNVTEMSRKSIESNQHENKSVERNITGDEGIATSTNAMKTPDLSQIIEGVKKVSPFCQLAVESPSINDTSQVVSTCCTGIETNPSIAMHDFLYSSVSKTTNLSRKESGTNAYSTQSVFEEHAGLDEKYSNVPYTDQTDIYKRVIRDTCISKVMHLGTPVYELQNGKTEIDSLHTKAKTCSLSSQVNTCIQNEFQAETLIRKDGIIVDDFLYNSQSMRNKRLKADGNNIAVMKAVSDPTVEQPGPTGDNIHVVDTDEWFDNVLLDIEDWLN